MPSILARGALKVKMPSIPSANEPMKIHLSEDRKVGPIPNANKALDEPDEPMKIHLPNWVPLREAAAS